MLANQSKTHLAGLFVMTALERNIADVTRLGMLTTGLMSRATISTFLHPHLLEILNFSTPSLPTLRGHFGCNAMDPLHFENCLISLRHRLAHS